MLMTRRQKWEDLRQYTSRDQLQDAIQKSTASPVVEGQRSVCWKIFLYFETTDQSQWTAKLRASRGSYESMRQHFLQAIEHQDEIDDPLNDTVDVSTPSRDLASGLQMSCLTRH